MKKRLLQMLCMLTFVAGLALLPTAAQAKSSVTDKGLISDGAIKFKTDMDGDGKNESIKITADVYMDYGSIQSIKAIKIAVTDNGKTTTTTLKSDTFEYSYDASIKLVTLDSKTRFINIATHSDNDFVPFNKLYKYNASTGKMKSVANLYRSESTINHSVVKSATSDHVIVEYGAQPSTIGSISFKLTYVYKDGVFKVKTSTVAAKSRIDYPYCPDYENEPDKSDGMEKYFAKNKFKTAKKLTFYTKAGGDTKAYTVAKNKFVTLKKIKLYKGHIYGQFEYNDTLGWKKLTVNPYKYESDGKVTGAWFKGVHERLAG